jgi:hypothetical protein
VGQIKCLLANNVISRLLAHSWSLVVENRR